MSTMNVLAAVPVPAKPSAGRAPQTVAADEFSSLLAGLVTGLAPVTVPPMAAQTGEASASPATLAGAGAATPAEVPVAPAAAPGAPAAAPSTPAAAPSTPAAAPSTPAAAAPTAPTAVPGIAAATPTPAGAPEAASTTRADVAVLTGGPAAPAPLMQGKATAAPRPHDPVLPLPAVLQRPVALDGVPPEPAPVEAETAASAAPTPSGERARDAVDEPVAAPSPAPAGAREPAPVSSALPVQDVAAAPVAEVRALASPVAPAPAAPAAPAAPPATQVLTQLAPVLEGPDGSYTMSLKLYPEELGAVQVEISLRGGEISVAMHAADDVSKELLRSSLADLRAQLEAHGLSAADLSVDSGGPDERDEPAAQRPRTRRDADDADDAPTPASAPDPDAALDLRM